MGYVETKYVAEELLRNAGRAGLPVAIYRPLDIVGSIDTGAWSTSTEMCALIRFMTDTGLAPDIDLPLDYVPADVCAAAIRHISVTEGAAGRTYHLASPEHALLGSLVGRLRDRGYRIDDVPSATGSASLHGRPPSTRRSRWRRSCRCSWTAAARPGSRWRRCTSRTSSRPTAAQHRARAARQRHRLPARQRPPFDRNIDRLMESGYLPTRPPVAWPPMPTSRYPDWESFEFPPPATAGAGDAGRRRHAPVAFCADLSPASVLGAYRRGIIPLPVSDEYFRTLNEFRYEDQVAAGTIGIVGDEGATPTGRPGGRPTRGR